MSRCALKRAAAEDVPIIVAFLMAMQDELHELQLDETVTTALIAEALSQDVHWFLFLDENETAFGTCYLQPVHTYWTKRKRYYMGGFYIAPTHRGKGLFREINALLDKWVLANDGYQIHIHIHDANEKSRKAFQSVGIVPIEYSVSFKIFETS